MRLKATHPIECGKKYAVTVFCRCPGLAVIGLTYMDRSDMKLVVVIRDRSLVTSSRPGRTPGGKGWLSVGCLDKQGVSKPTPKSVEPTVPLGLGKVVPNCRCS